MRVPTPYVPFDDLNDDQLHDLEPEAVDWYIDRLCAEEGVKLLPPAPPDAPNIRAVPKSVKHYIVTGLRFSDQGAAQRVADAITAEAEFRRTTERIGDRYHYNAPQFDTKEDRPEESVTVEQVYNRQECEEQERITTKTADAKEAYDTAKKDYDTVYSERSNVARRVWNRISEAHTKIARREHVQRQFERYVELAGGDATIAARFLWKAFGTDAELIGITDPGGWTPKPAPAAGADVSDEIL